MKTWKKADCINPVGKVNQLKVAQINDKLLFYINDVKVDERKSFQMFGNKSGIMLLDTAR